jgi:hypothetical protein
VRPWCLTTAKFFPSSTYSRIKMVRPHGEININLITIEIVEPIVNCVLYFEKKKSIPFVCGKNYKDITNQL